MERIGGNGRFVTQMNSTYGAMLNAAFLYGDRRMGASTTASGRQITTHMVQAIGYALTGEECILTKKVSYDKKGRVVNEYSTPNEAIIYGDTDSVGAESMVLLDGRSLTIADAFDSLELRWMNGENEFSASKSRPVTPCYVDGRIVDRPINAIYRHKVKKPTWKITLADGSSVRVTEDHSIMVERNGQLMETRVAEINVVDDICIRLDHSRLRITSIEFMGEQEEYVYDIVMEDPSTPYFFANGILVHNSCYFKCIGATDKESAIAIADVVADGVNESFPDFARKAFLCQPGFDNKIKCGREIVFERGLFQAKKKYLCKVVNQDGHDVVKLKSMGSEIKKSDTPRVIQKFLKATVNMILDGKPYDETAAFVNQQRRALLKSKKINPFSIGVVKQVNDLDKYEAEYKNPGTHHNAKGGKLTITGHARAACNYNAIILDFEPGAPLINSGDKVAIFYLKPNGHGFKSIAFPSELDKFPEWFFLEFEVDKEITEQRMFDSKLEGIFAALGQDVPSPQSVLTNSILKF